MKTYRYTSYRTMTPWEATKAWSAKRKAMREDFEERVSTATSAFTDAWTSQSSGSATLAAQASLNRIGEEAKQKAAAAEKAASASDNLIPSSTNSVFSVMDSMTLNSGAQVDLNTNTMTMQDGSVIDLNTGTKKINVTV